MEPLGSGDWRVQIPFELIPDDKRRERFMPGDIVSITGQTDFEYRICRKGQAKTFVISKVLFKRLVWPKPQ